MAESNRSIGVGIIGLGTVGGGVVRLIGKHNDDYLKAYGVDLVIERACALDPAAAVELGIPEDRFTSDWREVASDPAVDIVIELIGGEHPATEIFETAFANGKHVVSANKALLGRHVEELARAAARGGVQLRCEAAAGGGIPIVGTLEHDLVGNEVLTIAGIVNGTTNYILSRMADEGLDFDDVLADAQRLGYAEADPSADVDGFDAASKIAILSSIGFRSRVTTDDVYMQGIRKVSAEDIALARRMGYAIKLLAIARNTAQGVDVRVHPTMIPATHQLAAVSGAMNAVYVVGDAVGETMFYGAGAGSFPTASAVVGDVLSLSEHISRGIAPLAETEPFGRELAIKPIEELRTRYYVRFSPDPEADVLACAVTAFSANGVGVDQALQLGEDGTGSIVVLTRTCSERDVNAALADAGRTCTVASVIRIEDVEAWTEGALEN